MDAPAKSGFGGENHPSIQNKRWNPPPRENHQAEFWNIIAVGLVYHNREGKLIPVSVKEGDHVLLPEYGGTEVELGEKEYHLYRDDDILGTLHD